MIFKKKNVKKRSFFSQNFICCHNMSTAKNTFANTCNSVSLRNERYLLRSCHIYMGKCQNTVFSCNILDMN